MSAARSADESAPDAVAAALADAPFVRIVARADGDALAAAGLLARALRDVDVPFQVRVDPDPAAQAATAADELTLAVGATAPDAAHSLAATDGAASVRAFATARALGVEPDPVLGLAGAVAAGVTPGAAGSDALLAVAEERDLLERRPGVAVPTRDLGDGLAHSTLLHAPFSGAMERTRAVLADLDLPAELDADAHRRVASLAAVETVGADGATPRSAEAVERALRPYATPAGPFETVGGYADVLGAVAREQPGTGVALALGRATDAEGDGASVAQAVRERALDAWREHALLAHTELRDATTGRYDGLFVARLDAAGDVGRLATAARLLRDFRSPEPVALVVSDGAAAVTRLDGEAATEAGVAGVHLGDVMADAAATLVSNADTDGDSTTQASGYGGPTHGEATFDADVTAFITAFREGL
ncbi:MAG: exonuclease RecJ [Haloferacaceae archaeon]